MKKLVLVSGGLAALLCAAAGASAQQVLPAPPTHARGAIVPAVPDALAAPRVTPAEAMERLRAQTPARFAPAPGASNAPGGQAARAVTFDGDGLVVGAPDLPVEARAVAFLKRFGAAFGLPAGAEMVVTKVAPEDERGRRHVRLQQTVGGVPVTGGEMIVQFRGDAVRSAHGRALPETDLLGLTETTVRDAVRLAPEDVLGQVRARLEKHLGRADFTLETPRLEILNRGLLETRRAPTHVTWFVEARAFDLREYLWLDARTGAVVLQFSQLPHARDRKVYDGGSFDALPGVLARSEGDAAVGDADIDTAYDYSGDVYDYFLSEHGRDSYDGAGAPLVSTIRHCPGPGSCPYGNAFWNGTQMVYGATFSQADDVDAHELTHAVTEHSAGLFYYMQSGALNESFSDIFGELVDFANGAGTDTAATRWQLGEDLPGIGAIRHMANPNAFGDPGRLGDSTYFYCAAPGGDGGGVHVNSGVSNHAFALMTDGGSYNGQTVTGIGTTAAGKIAYRVLTEYLVSSSDFYDAYLGYQAACDDLIGTSGITAATCTQVKKALDAVEMGAVWPCNPTVQLEAPVCGAGQTTRDLFFDDFESGATA